jgi:two-component system, NtrC family, nitrogen regulation response regulator GlnG
MNKNYPPLTAITPEQNLPQQLSRLLELHLPALAANENLRATGIYHQALHALERPLILWALAQCRGNQIQAAKLLGINRNTLHKKIKTLTIPLDKRRYHGQS